LACAACGAPAAIIKDRAQSLRLETPVIGSVMNVYRGGGLGADALADHSVKQLPALGWCLVSQFERDVTILAFLKVGMLCFLGIGLDQRSPTLSVLVGKSGSPEAPAAGAHS
jgi:hypothetical protein